VLIDPETQRLFRLTPAEKLFLWHAFEQTSDGRLKYPELIFSGPKKSGKTAFAAMILIFVVRAIGGRYAEGYCVANSHDQASLRVFQAAARIVEASPMLAADAKVTGTAITFNSTGGVISAIPSDYSTAAGANPSISVFDELWGYTSERDHRLWDEMVPPPTRELACRLTVTYAGFEGESELLEGLYKRGIAGQQVAPDLYVNGGLLMYWSHQFSAPWQTEQWREQMREQLRHNAYLRLIENQWVSTESDFLPIEWCDRCIDPAARLNLGDQRAFQVRECRFDPYQMQASAQRLLAHGVPMVEFPQTTGNLTEASSNLYELVKFTNLVLYRDEVMRVAVQRSVAIESPRGWRIAKEKASHKIDVVVALAQAALGAVSEASEPAPLNITDDVLRRMATFVAPGSPEWMRRHGMY